ncbi:MAG: phosphotyrosine protein phosphatase [Candidatus Thiodiazotropha sp. (ex Lucinoma kastoroae)]|nr:phosphotyrosine protein phosphatase [Candidatus Thiodiazotropha sp. (ex Rostrolucina anterorostrata)]MCU7849081.1 phosphotyrosine protein phosphatase [Candidatus Thiodiazotropha sp. (ex Lucinoma kastoroae)]
MTNILFICSECRLRSPTAAEVFSDYEGVDAIAAGTNADAETPLSGDLVEWADVVLVMEKSHKNKATKKFNSLLKGKKIAVLGIPDEFEYMQTELVNMLKTRVPRYVRL